MNPVAIKVENLSKRYRLGLIGGGTLSGDLNRWWARVRHKPDPTLKIGQTGHGNIEGETIWALRDISFEVQQGEVLGIIGRNGAGKSTLLKILSRITAPTSGQIKVKGLVGSLLEVGTGFHPELTGRENIYLNGVILGMKRAEIDRKFDEIVDFSGVEQFIDTPVKRYSSGMYVRLAFAVAAHLDPEILVVDEVLAVGDAGFQKKCLGKMGEVAREGRTVLFVSHNMVAVQNLCDRTIVLNQGNLSFDGPCDNAVSFYLRTMISSKPSVSWDYENAPGNNKIRLLKAWVSNNRKTKKGDHFTVNDDLEINIEFFNLMPGKNSLNVTIHLQDERGILVFVTSSGRDKNINVQQGLLRATCRIPGGLLNQGTFTINRLLFVKDHGYIVFGENDVLSFDVMIPNENRFGWMGKKEGVVRPKLDWTLAEIEKSIPIEFSEKK